MPPEPNSPRPSDERLESWKEIASYLKKGVRTVQRWERTERLPVRRHGQDRPSSVFAYKSELDKWWQEQGAPVASQSESAPTTQPIALRRVNWRSPVHRMFMGQPDRTSQYAALLRRLADEGF